MTTYTRNPGCAKCRRYRLKRCNTGNLHQCMRRVKVVETGYDPVHGPIMTEQGVDNCEANREGRCEGFEVEKRYKKGGSPWYG